MATRQHYFALEEFVGERRAKPRIAPELLTYVSFGGSNGGMILDVSEGGLAVATAFAIPEASLVEMVIPTDAVHERIEATVRVAWIGESKRRVGVQVVEASPGTQEALRKWICAMQCSEAGGSANAKTPVVVGRRGFANLGGDGSPAESAWAVETVPTDETSLDVPEEIPVSQVMIVEPVATPEQPVVVASNDVPEPEKPQIMAPKTVVADTGALKSVPLVPLLERPGQVVMAGASGAAAIRVRVAEPVRTIGPRRVGENPKMPGPSAKSQGNKSSPSKTDIGKAQVGGTLRAVGVAEKRRTLTTTKARPFPLAAALVIVVLGGFLLGLVIGRSVLERWTQNPPAANAPSSPSAEVQPSAVPLQPPVPSPNPSGGKPDAPDSDDAPSHLHPSVPTLRSASDQGRPAVVRSAEKIFDAGQPVERQASPGNDVKSDTLVEDSQISAAGGEALVTPNEGDAPLRVDLGEEVLAHLPSLEIRARRFVMVPGEGAGRHHKARRERLVVGPMISRVTPQPPASATNSASTSQFTEQTVFVRATIRGDGDVVYVDPLSGPLALIPGVITAVRQWRYEPSSLGGKPIETQVELMLTFRPLR
ncbi:MAG: PilZ domain-containing protein [Candidatus Acidiferrum sp.]|jgi:hypothetical protein